MFRTLLVAGVLLVSTSPGHAAFLPPEMAEPIAVEALKTLWRQGVSPDGARFVPASHKERTKVPLGRRSIRNTIFIAELTAAQRWCSLEDELPRRNLIDSAYRHGLSDRQIAYAQILLDIAIGHASTHLKEKEGTCNAKNRRGTEKWVSKRIAKPISLADSAPSPLIRANRYVKAAMAGVWAPSGVRLNKGKVAKGPALYIGRDGFGAIVTNGNQTAKQIVLHINDGNDAITYTATGGTTIERRGTIRLAANGKSIQLSGALEGVTLRRVSKQFTARVRNDLGVVVSSKTLRSLTRNTSAQRAYYQRYRFFHGHRAFAITSNGHWALSRPGAKRPNEAQRIAMQGCEKRRTKRPGAPRCYLLDTDGRLQLSRKLAPPRKRIRG